MTTTTMTNNCHRPYCLHCRCTVLTPDTQPLVCRQLCSNLACARTPRIPTPSHPVPMLPPRFARGGWGVGEGSGRVCGRERDGEREAEERVQWVKAPALERRKTETRWKRGYVLHLAVSSRLAGMAPPTTHRHRTRRQQRQHRPPTHASTYVGTQHLLQRHLRQGQ
ncbi:hypothetical protein C0Q70_18383 [Pomacea canaliculata]|uniref:Uncharacterized protein n=1 Tax=Pomacea canaliculata TaxID=400727 RepID=A0A2T7NN36_POMCA|nr:hypothetical protein C0Q70_18383 [Pomacea canaliculata]